MPETRLVADEDFAWAERVPVRAAGRWVVIQFPAVVCTGSPSTTNSLGVRSGLDPQRTTPGLDSVPVGSRVACRGQRRYFSGALL